MTQKPNGITLIGEMNAQPVALVFADAPCEICGVTMTQKDFDDGQGMALTGKTAIYPAHLSHFYTGEPPSPVPEYEENMRRLATRYGEGEGL
jgi:hypothetical protein